jgi:hypothetical protein
MSELNYYSFSVQIGKAVEGIAKIISRSCSALNHHKLKDGYLATAQREMLLETLYDKNLAELKKRYPISDGSKVVCETQGIDLRQDTRIRAIHTVSMFESLSQVEPMALVAKTRHRDKWEKMNLTVSTLKHQLKAPKFDPVEVGQLVEKSETPIREMSYDTHSFLAKTEQELMLKKLTESVTSMAYSVKTDGMSLIASKGSVSIRAKVGAGIMALDTTSFPGISCHAQMHRIEKDLKQRGLVLRRLCEHNMRLRKGGVRLNDPFPACPADGQNHILKRKVIAAAPEKKQLSRESASIKRQNGLIHQYLRQMDSRCIKEKVV